MKLRSGEEAGNKVEKPRFSTSYDVTPIERDGHIVFESTGPYGVKMRAEVVGDGPEKTLRLLSLTRSGISTESDRAILLVLKNLMTIIKDRLDEAGNERLERIEVPTDKVGLKSLWGVADVGVLLGQDQVAHALRFHNPSREEQQSSLEKFEPIVLTIFEITEGFKRYEMLHGEIL